jgi:hypothetical protein
MVVLLARLGMAVTVSAESLADACKWDGNISSMFEWTYDFWLFVLRSLQGAAGHAPAPFACWPPLLLASVNATIQTVQRVSGAFEDASQL